MSTTYGNLTQAFEARTLDASAFRHVDHVGVACEMLRKYDFMEAVSKYSQTIRDLTQRAGVPQKFNITITVAFLGLIAERMAGTDHGDFETFISANSDLLSKDALAKWYTPERLSSDTARKIFLLPDQPL